MDALKGKYVIARWGQAILFSNAMKHSDFKWTEPVAAGFFEVFMDINGELAVATHGFSTTLGLSCRVVEDAQAIRCQFGVL